MLNFEWHLRTPPPQIPASGIPEFMSLATFQSFRPYAQF